MGLKCIMKPRSAGLMEIKSQEQGYTKQRAPFSYIYPASAAGVGT